MSSAQVQVEDELFKNQYRQNFEDSLNHAISISGINLNKEVTAEEIQYMDTLMKGELTWDELKFVINRIGEKQACNIFSNGNLAEFNDLKKDLKAIKDEQDDQNKENPMYVTPEIGKQLQDPKEGRYAPAHATHLNKGLGDNAGWVGRFNTGYVWRLFADGYIREIKADMVKKLFMERYDIIPSENEAQEIASLMNKERRVFEGQILQGDIGDSRLIKDAVSIITNEGKKLGLSYEKTDMMGKDVRKACEKFEHEAGKIIGKAKVKGDCEEIQQKTVRMFANFIEQNNLNADNCVSMLLKLFSRRSK